MNIYNKYNIEITLDFFKKILYNIYKYLRIGVSSLSLFCYKIAVIIAGIDQSYQSEILNGIEDSAAGFSINVDTFVSFSGIMGNKKHDTGEFNIFNLPDFSKYDGAVLLTNTVAYKPVIDKILDRIKKAGIPTVSIDNDIAGFYYIGSDNHKAMRNIAEHFINHHRFNRFCYVSGPKDNPESKDRLNAFLSVMRENNITVPDDSIFHGDFRAPSGKAAVKFFLNSDNQPPQAIICANDVMAVSVMNALSDFGLRIPDDICVSGFDNTYNTHNYPIELTSVDRPLKLSGELACRTLFQHFTGIPQDRKISLDMQPKFTESCGCSNSGIIRDIKAFKNLNYENFTRFQSTLDFTDFFNRISCKLNECYSLDEYIESLKCFISELNPQELYICLCSDWNTAGAEVYPYAVSETASYTVDGYTDTVTVPLAYKNGEFLELDDFPSVNILPDIDNENKSGRVYFIVPLHFGERCLGYLVTRNCSIPTNSAMFQTWCLNLSNSIENIRKIICLEHAVKRLDKLYTLDTFSGILNRNGFVIETNKVYNTCVETGCSVMLLFIDLDGLKKINDTFGHDIGDIAIQDIANVIRSSCTDNEVYCRFGGDEFIIFGADYNEKKASALTAKINLNIEKINASRKNPFKLSASLGYYITKAVEGADIFQFVTVADNIMYREKRKKKLSKYLKS